MIAFSPRTSPFLIFLPFIIVIIIIIAIIIIILLLLLLLLLFLDGELHCRDSRGRGKKQETGY